MELSVQCSFCLLDAHSTLPGQLWHPKLCPGFARCLLGRREGQDHHQMNWEALPWTIIWPVSLLAKHSADAANKARTVFSRLPWAAHIKGQCVLRALRHWAKISPHNSGQGKGEAASVLDPGPWSRAQHHSLPQHRFSAQKVLKGNGNIVEDDLSRWR